MILIDLCNTIKVKYFQNKKQENQQNVSRTDKDKVKERYQRNMQERKLEGQEQEY